MTSMFSRVCAIATSVAAVAVVAVGSAGAAGATVSAPQSQHARMTQAIAYIRSHDSAMAHASDQKIESLVTGMAKTLKKAPPAATQSSGMRADFLGVSKSGDTLWFNKAQVVFWAVASTAVIIASLMYMGVEVSIAYDFVHQLLDILWQGTFGHKCAWFTYNSPRSLGTYSC
jgi:hypothetical protein